MPLRCLLFSPDAETLGTIGQVLTELEIEGEQCFHAVEAVEKVTARPFQLVIIDWSSQPEAGFLLNTARERKAADRPLTLAVVSDDASVPTALQAGANSVLRKPLLVNQVKDTLATARDLLRAKFEAPVQSASPAAAANSLAAAAMLPMEVQTTLHAGEFLQPSGSVPSPQFETESSDVQKSLDQAAAAEIDPLKDLEPTAAPMSQAPAQSAPSTGPSDPTEDEPRGLAWYLKTRAKSLPADEQDPDPVPSQPEKAQLLGYDQPQSYSAPEETSASTFEPAGSAETQWNSPRPDPQQREEAALFAYITGDKAKAEEKEPSPPRPWLKKLVIASAVAAGLAVAYFTVPRTVLEKQVKIALAKATRAGHSWLNPQPATPQQIQAHENFERAGDEYKLPVVENIPDANTDPSQIRVLPVVDPSAKPANNAASGTDQPAAQANPATTGDPTQIGPNQIGQNQNDPNQTPASPPPAGQLATSPTADGQAQPNLGTQTQAQTNASPGNQSPLNQAAQNPIQPGNSGLNAPAQPAHMGTGEPAGSTAIANSNPPLPTAAPIPTPAVQTTPVTAVAQPLRNASYPASPNTTVSTPAAAAIPSSLKSSMAQMSPEASGNKPPEAALPSIEPVNLPEAAARGLLMQGPAPVYPPSAAGASGSVVLQVLIGRDGSVEDAKFLQGSLAFARPAIDAVRQWHFKPYLMNGRPASTQTLLTLGFKPGS